MKTLKYYKQLQAEAQRAQTKYNRALLALQTETKQASQRMERASKTWRSNPNSRNRQTMLLMKKSWADRIKILEALLGRLYAA